MSGAKIGESRQKTKESARFVLQDVAYSLHKWPTLANTLESTACVLRNLRTRGKLNVAHQRAEGCKSRLSLSKEIQ